MTVLLINNEFKYETEAVIKLFFPVRRFGFVNMTTAPSSYPDGDFALLELNQGCVISVVRIGDKTLEKQLTLESGFSDSDAERAICRLLFLSLRELTGIYPRWGMLTGVRPVKLIYRLRAKGLSNGEISRFLAEQYYVSEEKSRLAVATADAQSEALKSLPKRGASLYVSVPFCPSRCSYCSFVSQTVAQFGRLMPDYVRLLCEELDAAAGVFSDLGLVLDTVYFGGGTPTSLTAEQLALLMEKIRAKFDLSRLREYTVEAGRPDTVTAEKLHVIKQLGADRISVNPQTLVPDVLEAIGRKHTVGQFFEAYELAEKTGFKAINVDLIAGLPTDTPYGYASTVDKVIALKPANITVHALSVKRAADLIQDSDAVSDAVTASEMLNCSTEKLTSAGYVPYYLYRQKNQVGNLENVGWMRDNAVGIYNVNMMEEVQTVIAVGAGGSTKLVAGDAKIERIYNPKYPLEYIKRFNETVLPRKTEAKMRLEKLLAEQ